MSWENLKYFLPKKYKCAYCHTLVASVIGYLGTSIRGRHVHHKHIYICPHCDHPTYFYQNQQTPFTNFGEPVKSLPDKVEKLYNEARKCTGCSSYTAAVMVCRKLLMHIVVEKGGDENKEFTYYVDWLQDNGYIPPDGKSWLDRVRTKGNEANHEIMLMAKKDAEELITFLAMLMKFIYEFPSLSTKQADPKK